MKITLVIMAAGLGSRYGGNKQVEGVGPHGEILMEYAIYDALRAGFGKVVFVIKPEMSEMMERLCVRLRQKTAAEAVCAVQDYGSLPDFYTIPQGRVKPYGTVHALLCAREAVDGPCCVINADDYYGIDAYQTLYDALLRLPPEGQAAMVGYLLKNTASLHGTVSRGVCQVKDGWLQSVRETLKIQLYPDGSLRDLKADRALDPESVVSMNFWGFMPSIFPVMQDYFEDFLRHDDGSNLKSECLLPVMVDGLMQQGRLSVAVLRTEGQWFGMTYQQDRPLAAQALAELHMKGAYPETLR
jgi:NDP-sugar pyrophosphorylase family protein